MSLAADVRAPAAAPASPSSPVTAAAAQPVDAAVDAAVNPRCPGAVAMARSTAQHDGDMTKADRGRRSHAMEPRTPHHRGLSRLLGASLLLLVLSVAGPISPAGAQIGLPDWSMAVADGHSEEIEVAGTGRATVQIDVTNEWPVAMVAELDVDAPWGMDVAAPDEITIPADSTETITVTFSGVDVNARAAGTAGAWSVTAVRTQMAGVVPDLLGDTREVSGQLLTPQVVDLELSGEAPKTELVAGGQRTIELILTNDGNVADRVAEPRVTDDCPQLEVNGMGDWSGAAVASRFDSGSNETRHEIVVDTSSSHPTRTCRLTVSVRSQLEVDAGRGGVADSLSIDVRIVAQADEVGERGDGPQDSEEVVQTQFAPAPGVALVWLGVAAAAVGSARRGGNDGKVP